MNKREMLLDMVRGGGPGAYTPAAFFLHFGPQYHTGRAAIDLGTPFWLDRVEPVFARRVLNGAPWAPAAIGP